MQQCYNGLVAKVVVQWTEQPLLLHGWQNAQGNCVIWQEVYILFIKTLHNRSAPFEKWRFYIYQHQIACEMQEFRSMLQACDDVQEPLKTIQLVCIVKGRITTLRQHHFKSALLYLVLVIIQHIVTKKQNKKQSMVIMLSLYSPQHVNNRLIQNSIHPLHEYDDSFTIIILIHEGHF